MKKNITINLCGRLFAIDEDAYEMLATYEQSLRNYFRTREGGEEIAEDLEARIAELFDELKAQGVEAITIDHVREVIHRIGRPEEMEESPSPDPSLDGAESENPSDSQQTPLPNKDGGGSSSKRLYRNPDDKKLMGVLSGFAAYFGGDVLWWRLGYAAIVLLSFAGSSYNFLWFLPHQYLYFHIYFWGIALIIAYVLLAVLMPVAETPEDRLRMKGKEVNPQNLAEEISRLTPAPSRQGGEGPFSSDTTSGNPNPTSGDAAFPPTGGAGSGTWGKGHRGPSGCISGTIGCIGGFFTALWTVFSTLFRWCIYAFGVFVAGMCLLGIVCLAAVALNPMDSAFTGHGFPQSEEFAAVLPQLQMPIYIFAIAASVVLAITAYAIIHSLLNEFKQMQSMPYRQRITLLVMWLLGLIVAGAAAGYGIPKFIKAEDEYNQRTWDEYEFRDRVENTHDGVYVQPHEWEFLQDNGWKILNAKGCNDRFTTSGQHLSGDRDVRYLDCYDDNHRQRYRVERTDTLQPGTYRLTCAARSDGTGACIYVIVGGQQPQFKEIPATGNTGGDIWVEADKFVHYHKDVPIPSDSVAYGNQQCELVEVNNHKGYGWNRITFAIQVAAPTVIRYGLTSDDAFTGKTWLGQWFSATDFQITRVE